MTTKKLKFESNPYKGYTVGITHAARAAMQAEVTALGIVPQSLHGREGTAADLVTTADSIGELARIMREGWRM